MTSAARQTTVLLTLASVLLLTTGVRTFQRTGGAAASGTGRIGGVVLTDGPSPQPIRRAIVNLTAADAPLGQSAISDDAGRFEFTALPAGRFTLTASRASFLTGAYGAARPGRPGTAVALGAGQQLTNVRLTLARGAVITGTVRDAKGQPVLGLTVRLERKDRAGGFVPVLPSLTTDDRGAYRAFGLTPGTYVVSAAPTGPPAGTLVEPTEADVDTVLRALQQQRGNRGAPGRSGATLSPAGPQRPYTQAPVFHPSAFSSEDAVPITVGAGEERRDVDIAVRLISTATIAGSVIGSAEPLNPRSLRLGLATVSGQNAVGARATPVSPDGSFRYENVVPGRYILSALISSPTATREFVGGVSTVVTVADPTGACMYGQTDVQVNGTDLSGVFVPLRPCMKIAGRVEFAGTSLTPPTDLTSVNLRVSVRATPEASTVRAVGVTTRYVQSNGTFVIGMLGEVRPGAYQFAADVAGSQPGKGWVLRSVMSEGRDVLDSPLVITDGSPAVTPIVVTFTDQRSALVGRLETATQLPAVDYTVLAFTTNQAWWTQPFRRVCTTRPATNGDFAFEDLPPGDYFLAALTDIEPDEWQDAAFLATIVGSAVRVTVGENERHTQNLRLAR